jgi:hypothetical protein
VGAMQYGLKPTVVSPGTILARRKDSDPMKVFERPMAAEIASEDQDSIQLRLTKKTCDALGRLNLFVGYYEEFPPDPIGSFEFRKT